MLAPGWGLLGRFLGVSDFSPFEINLSHVESRGSPDLGPRLSNVLFEMIPGFNLESCPIQLSKFGEPSELALQIWLPWDFQIFQTPNRLLTPDRGTSNPKTVSKKDFEWWHQFSIWRAVQISSPNLVTDRLLTDFFWINPQSTPDWPQNSPWWTQMDPDESQKGPHWVPGRPMMDPDRALTNPLMNPYWPLMDHQWTSHGTSIKCSFWFSFFYKVKKRF